MSAVHGESMAKVVKDGKRERHAASAASVKAAPAAKSERETLDERQMLLIAKAIADPRRMVLLRAIARKASTCANLRECLPISAATLSHHMKELEIAGLIATTKDGRFLNATLQKKTWKGYISALKALVD